MKFHNTLQETNRPRRRPPPSEYHRERRKHSDEEGQQRGPSQGLQCSNAGRLRPDRKSTYEATVLLWSQSFPPAPIDGPACHWRRAGLGNGGAGLFGLAAVQVDQPLLYALCV